MRAAAASSRFRLLQIFREELGDLFELGNVIGIYGHERLMRFQAGFGQVFLRNRRFGRRGHVEACTQNGRAFNPCEKVGNTQVIQESALDVGL